MTSAGMTVARGWRRGIASAIALLLAGSVADAQQSRVVKIDSGAVSGSVRNGIAEYLGIPYSAPPVGKLRWMPPQPVGPWTGVLATNRFGNTCAQNSDLGVFAKASAAEDCLYLNVYVDRAVEASSRLPVLVWIHGGGLSVGAGSDHDGSRLAANRRSVVVTFNYRLGALGFLAHPALDKEKHAFANYGILDQQAALQWVKRNIAAFGGDPGNVTLFGESSGGTSVMTHIVSPGSRGLFQHGIAMSGSAVILRHPAFGAPRPLESARELGTRFAAAAGCADQTASCLRKLPVSQVLAVQTPHNQAIIDGTIVPLPYGEAFKAGRFNPVTLVNGSTRDEWTWMAATREIATGRPLAATDYTESIRAYYGEALAARVLAQYPLTAYASPSLAYSAAVTDSLFACTGRKVNQWLASQVPTYAYEFADQTAPSYLAPVSFPLLAAHTFELQYLFPGYRGGAGIAQPLNPLQQKLSDAMVGYWTQVARAPEGRLWARYDPQQDNYQSLALPAPEMTVGRFGVDHKCSFWDQSGLY